jgi:serine phosphatase RsbU (regulator of sigma subunit)
VGVFDNVSKTLSYVNCGQEPALLRRCSISTVEQLASTGPIIGAIKGVKYESETALISTGDVLAIFTDGITEIGEHRTELFGVDGVAQLFCAEEPKASGDTASPREIAVCTMERMISGANTFAKGGVRDDMTLLIAVACD